MNREHLEELVSRSLDGDLSPAEQHTLDQALAQSPELRELAADLTTIRQAARIPTPTCPPHLFTRMEAAVAEAHGRPTPAAWLQPLLALAAVALFSFGLGTLMPLSNNPVEPDTTLAGNELKREIQQAQQRYHAAIAKLEAAAVDHMAQLPPTEALKYAQSLRDLNRAITDCERLLDGHEDDHFVYASLSRAWQSKVTLLQKILDS